MYTHKIRPTLKGASHVLAAIVYAVLTPYLIQLIPQDIMLHGICYMCAQIGHFGASAAFHCFEWPKSRVIVPRRIDHVMIFLTMLASYDIITLMLVPDINPIVTIIVWLGACIGIITRVAFTKAPKPLIGIPYILLGWSVILDTDIMRVAYERSPEAAVLLLAGGIAYTIGGCIYVLQCPNFYPRTLGFHELFHIFTIIGCMYISIAIFGYIIPYYKSHVHAPEY